MKTKLFTLFLALAASVGAMFAKNEDVYAEVDGIWYELNNEDMTASVTYKNPSAFSLDELYSGSIVIPLYVYVDQIGKTYKVTSIGEDAFVYCEELTSVTIPNSVTSIGVYAFGECTGLTSVTIPNSVTSIGEEAFADCTGLTSITCKATTPPNCDTYSFIDIDLSIPIYVPAGSVATYRSASVWKKFTNIQAMKDVPEPIIDFGMCGDNLIWELSSDNELRISGIGDMYNYEEYDFWSDKAWFLHRESIKSVIIGNSVTSIGDYAFGSSVTVTITAYPNLTSVTIGNSVTSIGNYAFDECTGLTSVTIGNSVTSIGNWAFNGCTSLTSPVYNAHVFAYLPKSYSGVYAIPDGIETIAGGAFYYCTSLTSVTIPNSVTSIGGYAFCKCKVLTSIEIPNSVTSIGDYVFYFCTGLTSVTIGNSVTSIGGYAFCECKVLTSVTIGNSVTSIGDCAFEYCSSLTSVTIPNSVTSIGGYAFHECTGLTSVTIGNSVTSIGGYAFHECTGLTSITCEAVNPPYCSYSSQTFYGVNKEIPLYVPAESVTKYQSADGWKDFHNIIGINAEDINLIESATSTTKLLRDGQVLIQKGDKIFDLRGQEVR